MRTHLARAAQEVPVVRAALTEFGRLAIRSSQAFDDVPLGHLQTVMETTPQSLVAAVRLAGDVRHRWDGTVLWKQPEVHLCFDLEHLDIALVRQLAQAARGEFNGAGVKGRIGAFIYAGAITDASLPECRRSTLDELAKIDQLDFQVLTSDADQFGRRIVQWQDAAEVVGYCLHQWFRNAFFREQTWPEFGEMPSPARLTFGLARLVLSDQLLLRSAAAGCTRRALDAMFSPTAAVADAVPENQTELESWLESVWRQHGNLNVIAGLLAQSSERFRQADEDARLRTAVEQSKQHFRSLLPSSPPARLPWWQRLWNWIKRVLFRGSRKTIVKRSQPSRASGREQPPADAAHFLLDRMRLRIAELQLDTQAWAAPGRSSYPLFHPSFEELMLDRYRDRLPDIQQVLAAVVARLPLATIVSTSTDEWCDAVYDACLSLVSGAGIGEPTVGDYEAVCYLMAEELCPFWPFAESCEQHRFLLCPAGWSLDLPGFECHTHDCQEIVLLALDHLSPAENLQNELAHRSAG